MSNPAHNLINQTFGQWIVLQRYQNDLKSGAQWLCRCTCGIEKPIRANALRKGTSTSCGCSRRPASKTCRQCGETKPSDKFKKKSLLCRACAYIYNRQLPNFRIRRQEWKLREKVKRYGIDETAFDKMLILQNGKCQICRKVKHTPETSLHIDHNHRTGLVRGLICFKCNLLIAAIENHPEYRAGFMQRVIQYLADEAKQQTLFSQANKEGIFYASNPRRATRHGLPSYENTTQDSATDLLDCGKVG